MDFLEPKDENLEQRKEIAEKRKLLLDNYEKNKTPPRLPAKFPSRAVASTPTSALRPPPNTPVESGPVVEDKESIGSGVCGSHVNPTTNSNMMGKVEQNPAKGKVIVEAHPDFLADGNKRTPIKAAMSLTPSHLGKYKKTNIQGVNPPFYSHPEMVFITSCPYTSQTVVTKFEIQRGKMIEVLDKAGRDLWGEAVGLYSCLSAPTKTEWLMRAVCCLEEKTNTASLYGDETHCLIEIRDLGARYSFQFYKGIYTWYVKFLDVDYHPDPTHKWSDFPQELFLRPRRMSHPFYRNRLVPRTHLDFVNCEALAKRHWKLQHKDCKWGHFRVNVYVNSKRLGSTNTMPVMGERYALSERYTVSGETLQSPFAKFISHRVCGHALVADLFRAMGGSTNGREADDPEDWQCLREVMWDRQTKPTQAPTLGLGTSYVYGVLKNEIVKTRMVDTNWFTRGRNYVWLLPTQDFCGVEGLLFDWRAEERNQEGESHRMDPK